MHLYVLIEAFYLSCDDQIFTEIQGFFFPDICKALISNSVKKVNPEVSF